MGNQFASLLEKPVTSSTGGGFNLPQLDSDPVAPAGESGWVLKQGGGSVTGGGKLQWIHGMALYVTDTGSAGGGAVTYQLSYRTLESTTIRTTLS